MLLLIRNSLAHPLRAGLWTVAGIAAGLSVHLTAVLTGLALAVKESRVLFPALLLTGGAWLSWMALQLIRTRPEPPDASTGDQRLPLADRAAFLQGLLTNLTNAKAVLFLATVVLAWLGTAPPPPANLPPRPSFSARPFSSGASLSSPCSIPWCGGAGTGPPARCTCCLASVCWPLGSTRSGTASNS